MATQYYDQKFDTMEDAQAYASFWKSCKNPGNEIYVRGPFFIDPAVTFKDLPIEDHDPYYAVNVKVFS